MSQRKSVIKLAKERDEFIMFEDGYYYYCPSNKGGIPAYALRELADELDKMNEVWDAIVTKELNKS